METHYDPLNDPPAHIAGDRATSGRKLSDVAKKSSMSFSSAARTEMPFGKYRGQMLDVIAQDDEGLKYLDYMRGTLDENKVELLEAICCYLDDETISKSLDEVLNGGRN